MFFLGKPTVHDGMLENRGSYYPVDVPGGFIVRRPFWAPSLLMTGGISLWAISFIDLLLPFEVGVIAALIIAAVISGWSTAHLRLASRELNTSGTSVVVWGTMGSIRQLNSEIAKERIKLKGAHSATEH